MSHSAIIPRRRGTDPLSGSWRLTGSTKAVEARLGGRAPAPRASISAAWLGGFGEGVAMTCSVNSIAIAPIDVVVIAIRATEIPSRGRSCLSDAARASAAPCLFRLKARWMTTAAVVRSDETMNHSSDAPLTLGSTAAASMQVGRTQAASAILMSVKAVEGFAQRVTASFRTRSQYVTATAAVLSNTNTYAYAHSPQPPTATRPHVHGHSVAPTSRSE